MMLTTSDQPGGSSVRQDGLLADLSRATTRGRVIAASRLAVAAGTLIAVFVDTVDQPFEASARVLMIGYGIYAVVMALVAWRTGFSSRRWQVLAHAIDVATFGVLNFFTAGANSPFFMSFVFVIVCAALLFTFRAVIASSIAILAIYVTIALVSEKLYSGLAFTPERFIARISFLIVITALIAFMKAYEDTLQSDTRKLAAWPRETGQDLRTLIREVASESADLLRAPRVMILWQDADSPSQYLFTTENSDFAELPKRKQPLVAAWNAGAQEAGTQHPIRSFVFSPAKGSWSVARLDAEDSAFYGLERNPIDDDFCREHHFDAALGAAFSGEMVSGWILALDRHRFTSDDLFLAEVVSSLVAARLDHFYLSERLSALALTQERLRVARDLHDGLLQSLSGAAVHLHLIDHVLGKDPAAARTMASDLEQALLMDQRELRSLIARLRSSGVAEEEPTLAHRVQVLTRRIETEWGLKTEVSVSPMCETIAPGMTDEVFRVLKEALTNAAMHSSATRVRGDIAVHGDRVHVTVEDNGHGFAFKGKYDLTTLKETKRGPLTLRERVTALNGDMIIESTPTGSRIEIRLATSLAGVER